MSKIGKMPYGLLHRDVLAIAVNNNLSKTAQRFYVWMLVNANPYTGDIIGNPKTSEIADALKTNKQSLYNFRDMFVGLGIYQQDAGANGIKGSLPHIRNARAEIKLTSQDTLHLDFVHPYANLIAGKIPRTFVEIAVAKDLNKFAQRHFWYITLNIAQNGHLTRLANIEDIGNTIGTSSNLTMLRSFKTLEKYDLFNIKSPSEIQGICKPVVDATEEALEQKRQREKRKAYKDALTAFLRRQEKIFGAQRKQPGMKPPKPGKALVKELKDIFRQHYEETSEFLVNYF